MHAQICLLPLASIGTWGWGWKSRKGNREKVLWHKYHLSVLFYSHVILAKPCTFPTHTVTNVIYRSNMVFYALIYARSLYFLFQTFYLLRNILKWDVATIALSHLASGYYTGRGNKCRKLIFTDIPFPTANDSEISPLYVFALKKI